MTWPALDSHAAYAIVFAAAAVEGEVVFVAACVLAGMGRLDPIAVLACGALGGSAGDQFFFYMCRGTAARWLDRLPALARRRAAIARRIARHAPLLILGCRFLPGLRIAIPAACAYAGVSPWLFSALSLTGGFLWAAAILAFVAWGGRLWLARLGVREPWLWIGPGLLVIAFFRWVARIDRVEQ
ncbi:MAG TPA: VTT domain-containing protein [Vicinamibacterales bacterium]|nr:VTT domain-containing protein [Vicinamibacterales bacterium]